MPELIVICAELRYAGKSLPKGTRFEASEKDAKVLKAIRKCADAPAVAPVRKVAETRPLPAPEPEAVRAEDPTIPDAPAAESLVPPARQYRTRRLKAED